jgi:protein TonB
MTVYTNRFSMRFSYFAILVAVPFAAQAQTRPAPAKAPITLSPGNMQLQPGGGADNRPDKAPSFPGGEEAMGDFFTQTVQVPNKAKQARVNGDVIVPAWQPATRRGVPVPIMIQVPVPFDNANVTKFEIDRKVPRSAKDAPGLN